MQITLFVGVRRGKGGALKSPENEKTVVERQILVNLTILSKFEEEINPNFKKFSMI